MWATLLQLIPPEHRVLAFIVSGLIEIAILIVYFSSTSDTVKLFLILGSVIVIAVFILAVLSFLKELLKAQTPVIIKNDKEPKAEFEDDSKTIPKCFSSHISNMQEHFSFLEKSHQEGQRQYPRWLCDKHLESLEDSLCEIREQINRSNQKGVKCTDEIKELFNNNNPTAILALCGGRKIENNAENEKYYDRFLDFAKNRNDPESIHVCRIFYILDNNNPNYDSMKGIIDKHRKYRKHGVLALTISHEKRSRIVDRIGPFGEEFCIALEKGFGFLLFFTAGRPTVIIHAGLKAELAFIVLKDWLSVRAIFRIFELLCGEANEIETETEKENVVKLLTRLVPSLSEKIIL